MVTKRRIAGYLVIEACEDYEQTLRLRVCDGDPPGGILDWGENACLFPSRSEARAAIVRTEHYRLAFNDTGLPEKRFCKVKAVETVTEARP